MDSKPQTPLEKLISDREQIQQQCNQCAEKLNGHFTYIQDNAGSLLLSGFTALLFPGSKQTAKKDVPAAASPADEQARIAFGISDYMSIVKDMLPVAWEVARPLLMSWGVKKARKWLVNLLFKKKKIASNN